MRQLKTPPSQRKHFPSTTLCSGADAKKEFKTTAGRSALRGGGGQRPFFLFLSLKSFLPGKQLADPELHALNSTGFAPKESSVHRMRAMSLTYSVFLLASKPYGVL